MAAEEVLYKPKPGQSCLKSARVFWNQSLHDPTGARSKAADKCHFSDATSLGVGSSLDWLYDRTWILMPCP